MTEKEEMTKLIVDYGKKTKLNKSVQFFGDVNTFKQLAKAEEAESNKLILPVVSMPKGTLCDFYDHDKQIDVDGVCDKCGGQEKTNH